MTGLSENGIIHLINSGAASLDGTGQQLKNGKPAMKPFWEITPEEAGACLDATSWRPANVSYFRGGGYSSCFLSKGGMPVTMSQARVHSPMSTLLWQTGVQTMEL